MMRMPERPTLTHTAAVARTARQHGTFQFHVDAFEAGEPREYNINYQADGYDNYYRLAARRAGQGLLVELHRHRRPAPHARGSGPARSPGRRKSRPRRSRSPAPAPAYRC